MHKNALAALSLLLVALTACGTPEIVPAPITQGPTPEPEAPATAVPIVPQIIASPMPLFIYMLNEQEGWGITENNLIRTIDGGSTWYDFTPPNASSLGYSATMTFVDAAHGWVLLPDANDPFSGTLYRTEDGGLSWTSFQVPFGLGVLHFLDAANGWMMASLGAGAGSMGISIFQTTDGGQHWTQAYTNDPNQPNAGDSLPLGGLKDGLTAVDAQTAWIGGIVYAPGTIYLYQTHDGGRSWTPSTLPLPPGSTEADFETRGPLFVSPMDAYLPVHMASQNGIWLVLYVSHDRGETWSLLPQLIPQGGSIDFVSPQDGFVWNGTEFYVTHDGAQTWTSLAPDVVFGEEFAGMDFVSTTVGFVLTNDVTGTRKLYKTTDGGATWTLLSGSP